MTEQELSAAATAEELANQQRALLDFAVSHSPAIFYIAVLEVDRPVKFISSNVETITGHSAESFLGEAGYGRRFVHADDLPAYKRIRRALMRNGTLKHEYRLQKTDGDYLWFRDELRLVSGGEDREIIGCMIDITQEKEADEERVRLARLFHDAVESLDSGFSVVDAEGRFVACNTALTRNLGVEPDSIIGKPRHALIRQTLGQTRSFDGEVVEESDEWAERINQKMSQTGGPACELKFDVGRWVLLTSHPTSEGGQVAVGTDITKLKQAERELRESERHFRSMVLDNPLPVWLVELESAKLLYASPAAAALVGRDWPFDGRTYTTEFFADPADRQALVERLRGEGGLVLDHETRFRRADGAEIWVALNTRFVEFQGKECTITGIVDLTERKGREMELRQARETLEDAIESLSEGLILYDAEDRVVLCNSQYLAFNHMSADLIGPGNKWIDITRERVRRGQFPNAVGRVETWLEKRISQRGLITSEEFPVADGRWYEHSHRRTREGGIVITWRDITERKELEAAIREREAMVRHVVDASPVPLTMIGVESGEIIYESPVAQTLFGYDVAEGYGSTLSRWVRPEDRRAYLARLSETGAVDGHELELKRRNGVDLLGGAFLASDRLHG